MKLTIRKDYNCYSRPWVLSRRDKHETRSQHAHFRKKSDAKRCRKMIDEGVRPRTEEYQIAVKRILTEKEYSELSDSNAKYIGFYLEKREKPRYINNQRFA